MQPLVVGIDIGGTKIAAALVSAEGKVIAREQIATLSERGPDDAVSRIDSLVRGLYAAAGVDARSVAAVGLGCPGPLDSRRGMVTTPPNLRSFWGFPLAERVRASLGAAVAMENDASAAALAEHRFGAGRGVRNLVYLTISTGIGGGVIINGQLYSGETGNAAEIGHSTIDRNGPRCACGAKGCLEALASGTAIAARARALLESGDPSSLRDAKGAISAVEVLEAVRAGDPLASRVWDEAMEALAIGLGNTVNVFNPGRIVLGGGLTAAGPLLFDKVRAALPRFALKPLADGVEIVPASLGADVGTLGAAAVALDVIRASPAGGY